MIGKNKKLIIILALALALTLAALALIIISGGANIDYSAEFREEPYIGTRVIEGGGPVKALDIKWPCGNVYIYSYDGEDIFLFESEDIAAPLSREQLIEKKQARISLSSSVMPTPLPESIDTSLITTVISDYDSSALMHSGIRKLASYWLGVYAGKDSRSVAGAQKDLYVLLPASAYIITVGVESNGCVIENLKLTHNLSVLTQNDRLRLCAIDCANLLTISSLDGDIALENIKCASLYHSTISGELEIVDSVCSTVNSSSIYGDTSAEGLICDSLRFESYFGSLELENTAPSTSIFFESISGDLEMTSRTPLSAINATTIFGEIDME